jgi:AcrR family transcriptional regulator
MPASEVRPRRRNKRGEGALLQEDIVRAAATLLETTGRDDALTLRAVARAAGITAPSIYAHFADRDEILVAVVERTFSELAEALRPGATGEPLPALYAVCRAYLDFAAEHPHRYRVLFQRHSITPAEPVDKRKHVDTMIGADAFGVLLDVIRACIDAGVSDETSAQAATVRVWVSLHGMATLRASLPGFPWPPREALLQDLITRVADLRPSGASPAFATRTSAATGHSI